MSASNGKETFLHPHPFLKASIKPEWEISQIGLLGQFCKT